MRLSGLLLKNSFEISVGGFVNKFKIRKRRDTFFFEEIASEYVKFCDTHGYSCDMMDIGYKWTRLYCEQLVPDSIMKIPRSVILNRILRKVWISGGLVRDLHASITKNGVTIYTTEEGMTRKVGENYLMQGFYTGLVEAVFKTKAELREVSQTKENCRYSFVFLDESPIHVKSKDKALYNKMNSVQSIPGITIKDLLKRNIFHLKNNNIYFRNMTITPVENTLFHIFGNKKILLDKVQEISYNYFKDALENSMEREKLLLIKNLMRGMGWGIVNAIVRDGKYIFDIKNPPYGLQKDKDNWEFLTRTILGYLWTIDRKIEIMKTKTKHKYLKIIYSIN